MYQISEDDIPLLAEFRNVTPRKPNLKLNRLTHRLKIESAFGKYVIATTIPGKQWAVVRTGSKRGDPLEYFSPKRYDKLIDAQCAVLRLRWEKHTTIPWPSELDW